MHFLNGDRIYIKPDKICGTFTEELQSCLFQIAGINSGRKIFKLNFFIDSVTRDHYADIRTQICAEVQNNLSGNILISVIAQPPLTGKVIVEVCFYDPDLWNAESVSDEDNGAVLFKNGNNRILIGNVQSFVSENCRENSDLAFRQLSNLFVQARFPINAIVRQWNYIEDILGFDENEQRYQEFNNVRSAYYGNCFDGKGYPSATGIGMNQGGVIIEFIAIQSPNLVTKPIDNPVQIAAHSYSDEVLVGEACVVKTTPKFERARYLELLGKKIIFISGTASIRGEYTVGVNDPARQTAITIENIKQLYSESVLAKLSTGNLSPKYGHARVYIKEKKDYAAIRRTFKTHFGNLPVVYIIADICRNDLLVEIEGKVILE